MFPEDHVAKTEAESWVMWHAINWLCAFCMILLFQNNNGVWYRRNCINPCFKSNEELEEYARGIQTNGNLLKSYRDLFRPILSHQHSTLIKYPLVQQTDNVDFNYLNKHLSTREKKFEHLPQYNFGFGKNHDSHYSAKWFLPPYKVLINPFFSRINTPSKPLESQNYAETVEDVLSNRPIFEPEIKMKGTRESEYYNYGVKKRKPLHKKKKDENDMLIYPHKGFGGLLLPSKIVLDNFSSWKWKNKKEIQTNNLSMSMVYNLLLPKSTTHKLFNKVDEFCSTTKKQRMNVRYESSDDESNPATRTVFPNCISPTDSFLQLNKKTQSIGCNAPEERAECNKKDRGQQKTNNLYNNVKNSMLLSCGCRNMYKDHSTSDDFTTPLAMTTEVPIIFKFDDYQCECYSCGIDSCSTDKQRKVDEYKVIRNKLKSKEKGKNGFEKENVSEINDKIDYEFHDVQRAKYHSNDDLNVAKYIIISNDGIIDPNDEGGFNYYLRNIPSVNNDMSECSTDLSRIKRRTFRCKSKWGCKRKRAFVPLHTYQNGFSRKLKTNCFSSPSPSYSKYRNIKIRKINKRKNRLLDNKMRDSVNKDMKLEISNSDMAIRQERKKRVDANIANKENKFNKKREFVGEKEPGNVTNPCEYDEEIITTLPPSKSAKTTFITVVTEKPTYSTFVSQTKKNFYSTFVSDTKKPTYSTLETDTESPTNVTFIEHSSIWSIVESTRFGLQTEKSTAIIAKDLTTVISPNMRPYIGNRHPSKLKCEQQYNRECVCSITKVLEEINNMISYNPDKTFLLNQLAKFDCNHYIPLEINYKMSPELKPRLISNKHKELLADEMNGPKEILDETFQELLIRDMPNEETDFYIFSSTNVEIPCFINDDVQLSPNTADSASYIWRQGDNKIITGGRVTEDLNHRGMLQITEATLADSDNYTCTVNYTNPDTGQTVSESFVHSVMVVTLPKFALHTLLHYTARVKCDQEILEMFELYLPQQVEDRICYIEPDKKKICSVEIHNPICHLKSNELQNVNLKSVWKFRSKGIRQNAVSSQENDANIMELSLNFELDIADVTQTMVSAANKTRCGPICQLKIILIVVNILRESFTIALPHPVTSSAGAVFKPDVDSINMKILIACEGGFKLSQGFCMPCPANTYSEEGSTECSKCRSGTYQPNIGSRTCEKCPHPFRSGCSSLWLSPGVIAITILIILLIVLISTALVFLCKYCFAHCMLSCFSPIRRFEKKKKIEEKETNLKKMFKIKKKMRKMSPRRRKEESTEPPTPPSEDFTS